MAAHPSTESIRAARGHIESALAAIRDDPGADHLAVVLKLAQRSLDARVVDVTDLIDAGHRLEDQGRYELAAEFYTEAVRLEPDAPRGWTNLGEVRRKLEQYERAVDAYDRALEADADYLWALAGKGESLRMQGRLDDCVPSFERALARSPDNLFCLQGLASALAELGRHREALPYWEQALHLRPDSGFASDGLERCHDALAQEAKAASASADG